MAAMKKNREQAYKGGMTQGVRKRMAQAVTIMTQAIRPKWITNPATGKMQFHRFSFITLTIACNSRNLTALQGYDMLLNHFLDWMTRTAAERCPALKTYIWKAEFQERGQLHYHITTPGYVHYKEIRQVWNRLQREAGLLGEFAAEYGHFDPNGTDIHDVRNVRQMDRYMIKELNKSIDAAINKQIAEIRALERAGALSAEDAREKIDEARGQEVRTQGRVWGCSEDLQGVRYFTVQVTRSHEDMLEQWVKEGKAVKRTDDFFAMVSINWDACIDPPDLLSDQERKQFGEHLKRQLQRAEAQPGEIPADCMSGGLDALQCYTLDEIIATLN